jgi:hypothetical protein
MIIFPEKTQEVFKMIKANVITVLLSIFQFKGICTQIIASSWQWLRVILPN